MCFICSVSLLVLRLFGFVTIIYLSVLWLIECWSRVDTYLLFITELCGTQNIYISSTLCVCAHVSGAFQWVVVVSCCLAYGITFIPFQKSYYLNYSTLIYASIAAKLLFMTGANKALIRRSCNGWNNDMESKFKMWVYWILTDDTLSCYIRQHLNIVHW